MKLSCATICVLAVSCVAGQAKADCPASVTNPLNLIAGTTWAFQTNDGLAGDATVGTFTAQVSTPKGATTPQGVLTIQETFNNAGSIGRQVTGTGSYQVNSDCSSGSLLFKVGNNSYVYAFVMAPTGTHMYLASANINVPNSGLGASSAGNRGVATLLSGPPTCNGANPLSTLVGTWGFLTQDYESSAVGIFKASIDPKSGLGVLTLTETSSGFGGNLVVQQIGTGQYQVYPDCSGGQINFNADAYSYQYAFVFAGPSQIYMVSDSTDSPNVTLGASRGNFGTATRF
ncbi:MAG: hypothetical protein JO061_13510 [Acidobacteriaceae bacterium]|nr:hypothetical protein [Acidobacteriaceae bacterium]